jgi:hypothetical protein
MRSFFLKMCCLATASIVLMGARCASQRQVSSKTKPSCATSLADCADEGCGTSFDPKLNLVKNITAVSGDPTTRTITWMQKLDDPDNFAQGDDRTELQQLGEGSNIVVVAYAIGIRKELSGESCNCYLHTERETDNHLVLVKKSTVDQMPLSGTTTAETTPRKNNGKHNRLQRSSLHECGAIIRTSPTKPYSRSSTRRRKGPCGCVLRDS